jgi:hypothetical protein
LQYRCYGCLLPFTLLFHGEDFFLNGWAGETGIVVPGILCGYLLPLVVIPYNDLLSFNHCIAGFFYGIPEWMAGNPAFCFAGLSTFDNGYACR